MKKPNSYKSGKLAELLTKIFLSFKGYKIIASNYITGKGSHAGEVDIVALKSKTIIFVEVKKRQNLDTAAYSIQTFQQRRIIRGAEAFLKKHQAYQNYDIRFDAVLVAFPFQIKHLKNAWQA